MADAGMVVLAIPFGLAIGLIVGAVGGGGAILALPVLVYILDEPVGPASAASLIVVAVGASVGGASLARHGRVCWRMALTFSAFAAVGSLVGAIANQHVSGPALILAFVPVMLVAAFATWQRAGASGEEAGGGGCPAVPFAQVAGAGFGVGALTGFFGVGGGFIIVPVLTLVFGLGFRRAVATSLVIITLTGVAGLVSHFSQGAHVIVGVTVALAASTAVGALVGTLVAERLPQQVLARAFAMLVAAVAVFLLVDTLAFDGPASG